MLHVLSTQSLLSAAGLRPTPAQATAVSWVAIPAVPTVRVVITFSKFVPPHRARFLSRELEHTSNLVVTFSCTFLVRFQQSQSITGTLRWLEIDGYVLDAYMA